MGEPREAVHPARSGKLVAVVSLNEERTPSKPTGPGYPKDHAAIEPRWRRRPTWLFSPTTRASRRISAAAFSDDSLIEAGRQEMEVNGFGPFALTQGFAPVLAKNGGGGVVNERKNIPMEKASPESVVQSTLKGIETGVEDILPDVVSRGGQHTVSPCIPSGNGVGSRHPTFEGESYKKGRPWNISMLVMPKRGEGT